jgi:5-methylcytosine-specific restriction endonuclease McrA
MVTRKQVRREMIRKMGSRCADCGQVFHPDDLIIHHKAFDRGEPLGYERSRSLEVLEYMRTGKLPTDVKFFCDRCNRKHHGYRPSKEKIFGDRL